MTSFFVLTACGPESTLEGAYEDCIEAYEEAEEEVEEADELEEFFTDLMLAEAKWATAAAKATAEIELKVLEMDEEDREDYVKELADRLKDLSEDCDKAEEKFGEAVADDKDILEDYMEWMEDVGKSYEDACEAADDEEYGGQFLAGC